MGSLSTHQIDHYWEHGYVVVPGVLEPDQIERYLSRAKEIARGDFPDGAANRLVKDIQFAKGELPMPDDPEHALWKIINPDRFDTTMAECLRFPRVLEAVSSLIGEDLLAFLLMFIYKPPGVAQSVHPFHQDAAYFPFRPQKQCVGVWIPLDPVSEANGGLTIVPGSHRLPIQQHEIKEGINFGALAAAGIEGNDAYHAEAITLELRPGDCVLFSTKMLHRTGGNRTTEHRRVVTLHMASAKCVPLGPQLSEYGFTSVQGETFEGCLQPVGDPALALLNSRV
ncbi:MAG: phytanoyl-CoA dioxygenase family protein [Candidatus Binatia bacterium]|nr:phytanoyl-CoA dioxygenase family protein [Candidatus Binatia bacterium]